MPRSIAIWLFALAFLVMNMILSTFTIILYSVLLYVSWTKSYSYNTSSLSLAHLFVLLGKESLQITKAASWLVLLTFPPLNSKSVLVYLFPLLTARINFCGFWNFLFFIKWELQPSVREIYSNVLGAQRWVYCILVSICKLLKK